MSDYMDVCYSPSAQAIAAYCSSLAQALGLTLEDADILGSLVEGTAHYTLHLRITQPFSTLLEFPTYTREQVEGYLQGETKDAIERDIRACMEQAKLVWQRQQQP